MISEITFKAFLLAYADNERNAALYIWDAYHESWGKDNKQVANVIVSQLDSGYGRIMTKSEYEVWYTNWANTARKIAYKYITQVF